MQITEIGPDDRVIIHVEDIDQDTAGRMVDLLRGQRGDRILLLSGEAEVLIVRGAR